LSSTAGAVVVAATNGILTSDQAAASLEMVRGILDAGATPGVTWKDWAVWLGGANGILWNPVVSRYLAIGAIILERLTHRRFPHTEESPR
jgi:hypothetical protein